MRGTRPYWRLAAAFLGACARQEPSEGAAVSTPAQPSASAPAAVLPALDPQTRGWAQGTWYHYRARMTTTLELAQRDKPIAFGMNGDLDVLPIDVRADGTTFYVAFRDAVSSVKAQTPPTDLDKVAEQLRGAEGAFVLAGGRVTEVRIPHGMPVAAANAYRQFVAAFQFARTVSPAASYTAEEYDAAGRYLVEYEEEPGSGGNTWHKHKKQYLALLGAAALPNMPLRVLPEITASDWMVHLSADGVPDKVTETDTIRINGAQVPVQGKTTIGLDALPGEGADPAAPDWTSLLASTVQIGASEPYGEQAAIEALDDARIHGLTFDAVAAALERIARGRMAQVDGGTTSTVASSLQTAAPPGEEKQLVETQGLYEALAAIFRRHPETIALALKRIDAQSPASPIFIAALGSASTDASETALVRLMNSKTLDPELKLRATTALARTPRPDQAAIDALTANLTARPFDESALYGLGTYSRRLRDAGQVDKARSLGELILGRLAAATTVPTRITVLSAIANSGYSGALAAVVPYLRDDREDLRASAVQALRSMTDASIDPLVASRLEDDPSSKVRISAIEAARVRKPSDPLAQALVVVATGAEDSRVRYRAVELMSAWLGQRPELRPTLEQIAQKDAEPKVRELAKVSL